MELTTDIRVGCCEFRVAQGPQNGGNPAENPRADHPANAAERGSHNGWRLENAATDHGADNQAYDVDSSEDRLWL